MFDLGWSEILIIVVVALVVIGPKDLPVAVRAVSKWAGKARSLARDFQDSMAELAKESELDTVKKDLEEFTRYDPAEELKGAADMDAEMEKIMPPEQELDENFEPIARRPITPTAITARPSSAPTPPSVDSSVAMGPTPPKLAPMHVPPTPEAVAAAPEAGASAPRAAGGRS